MSHLKHTVPLSVSAVPKEVIRSLYRSVLKEASRLDKDPLTRTLLPIPKKLQLAAGFTGQLHMPGQLPLKTVARRLFREPNETLNLKTGFDALTTLRSHIAAVKEELPRVTRDRQELLDLLRSAEADSEKYWARPVEVPLHLGGAKPNVEVPEAAVAPWEVRKSTLARTALLRREGFELKVGQALIAHPLSSAHTDRRVLLIVEQNAVMTTALVLDMLYSYSLSHGNPMFPEVFWGHDVHNGGYCHVDFTMPPTANISVLHTLEPPNPAAPNYSRWLQWVTQSGSNSDHKDPVAARAQHDACCHRVIPSDRPGAPTLYYSKVEALPYLASLAQGQPRSALRIYWGCMKWMTAELASEVALGHWLPVQISSSFFGAYGQASNREDDHFPSDEELAQRRRERERAAGADLCPPQVFPPAQPICRREALWDQILFSLGGDYQCLVGCMNPFASPKGDYSRVPPIAGLSQLRSIEPHHDGAPDEIDIPDDDGGDLTVHAPKRPKGNGKDDKDSNSE